MLKDFFDGILAYGKAINLISKFNLWSYLVIPALISLLLAIGLFAGAYGIADNIGEWIMRWYPWEAGSKIVHKIAEVMGGLLVIIGGLLIYKNLVIVLAGPFMSPLSEKVERMMLGVNTSPAFSIPQMVRDFSRGLQIAVRNIIRELFFTLLLLLAGLIPIFSPFTTLMIFLVQAYYVGFGNFDFFLERHFRVKGSIQFIKRNKMLTLGNGVIFMLLLITVVGFLIAPTLSTIAATIEGTKRLQNTGELREEITG